MLDAAFTFLFKYPLLVFEQGDFAFGVSRTSAVVLLAVAGLAAGALITYRSIHREGSTPRDRVVLIGLRLAALAVLLFCLARPELILKAAVPQQNFLGVLIDDSRSMLIADRDGQPRSEFVQRQLGSADSALLKSLSDRFVLRYFRFSTSAGRVSSPAELRYDGTATRQHPRAFGTNAYTAEVGDEIVEEHTESTYQHEEMYVVVRGRATFTLDGDEIDAPAGTIVHLPDRQYD